MKIKLDIDCTPQEARAFFGLPNVAPMQERLMADIEEQIKSNMSAMDPDNLMRYWVPGGFRGLEDFQKSIWTAFTSGMAASSEEKE